MHTTTALDLIRSTQRQAQRQRTAARLADAQRILARLQTRNHAGRYDAVFMATLENVQEMLQAIHEEIA